MIKIIKQKGATLAITLFLLLIITLIGVSSIQVSHLEEKMADNLQNKQLSLLAAESALKTGEEWLVGLTKQPNVYSTCPAFPCLHESYQNIDFATQSPSWWIANSSEANISLANVSTKPRFIIEFVQFVPDSPLIGSSSVKSTGVYYYQITARGTGSSEQSVTILQSSYARRF